MATRKPAYVQDGDGDRYQSHISRTLQLQAIIEDVENPDGPQPGADGNFSAIRDQFHRDFMARLFDAFPGNALIARLAEWGTKLQKALATHKSQLKRCIQEAIILRGRTSALEIRVKTLQHTNAGLKLENVRLEDESEVGSRRERALTRSLAERHDQAAIASLELHEADQLRRTWEPRIDELRGRYNSNLAALRIEHDETLREQQREKIEETAALEQEVVTLANELEHCNKANLQDRSAIEHARVDREQALLDLAAKDQLETDQKSQMGKLSENLANCQAELEQTSNRNEQLIVDHENKIVKLSEDLVGCRTELERVSMKNRQLGADHGERMKKLSDDFADCRAEFEKSSNTNAQVTVEHESQVRKLSKDLLADDLPGALASFVSDVVDVCHAKDDLLRASEATTSRRIAHLDDTESDLRDVIDFLEIDGEVLNAKIEETSTGAGMLEDMLNESILRNKAQSRRIGELETQLKTHVEQAKVDEQTQSALVIDFNKACDTIDDATRKNETLLRKLTAAREGMGKMAARIVFLTSTAKCFAAIAAAIEERSVSGAILHKISFHVEQNKRKGQEMDGEKAAKRARLS